MALVHSPDLLSTLTKRCLALAIGAAFIAGPSWAGTSGLRGSPSAVAKAPAKNIPGVAPISSKPGGKSYSEWAAAWWQWALQTPATNHPAIGGPCSSGQAGNVWFLGVNFDPTDDPPGGLTTSCTVPTGTSIFLPLINSAFFAFLNDPPAERTEDFMRAVAECTDFSADVLRIDGVDYSNAASRYLERSVVFDVQLPVDNVFGLTEAMVPQLKFSPSVDMGYYLFIRPLSVGTHLVEWNVSMTCPRLGEITQQQKLTITVVPKGGA